MNQEVPLTPHTKHSQAGLKIRWHKCPSTSPQIDGASTQTLVYKKMAQAQRERLLTSHPRPGVAFLRVALQEVGYVISAEAAQLRPSKTARTGACKGGLLVMHISP